MFKYSISFLFLLFITIPSRAQITVSDNSNVAIGPGTPVDQYKLMVECSSSTNCGGSGTRRGIDVVASSAQGLYGVYATASNGYGGVGIRGYASGSYSYNRGIWGAASGNSDYGGYFTQGIYVSGGIYQSSDERLKTNVSEVRAENVSSKILQLKPLRYQFLSKDALRQRGLPASHTDEGEHFGLSAQDVEQLFPELVSEVVHILGDEDGEIGENPETVTTMAINYQELTVLLLATVQEQQQRIEALEEALAAQK